METAPRPRFNLVSGVVGTLSKTYNFRDMRFRKFTKLAFPVWTRVPGTPFTLPGSGTYTERLPGMEGWVPRDVVERVSRALAEGEDIRSLSQREGREGAGASAGLGAGVGGVGGLLAARLAEGEAGFAPFKDIAKKGLTRDALRGLSKIPLSMKLGPLAGAAAGGLGMLGHWAAGASKREDDAQQVARGLMAEKVLQRRALEEAVKSPKPYVGSILRGLPITSASSPPPYVTMPGGANG